MKKLDIVTVTKTYPVFIGQEVINELPSILKQLFSFDRQIMIITDRNIAELHLPTLENVLENFNISTFITPIGEKAKTFEVYYEGLTFALDQKMDRSSILLAFGGGAIGDLGGFIASTFMRGIPFIQIPTTILAHDSAVGGKVAINHPVGKNMIGSFYQPDAVIYDLNFIRTLSLREKQSGFAEVIKHALIYSHSFYQWLVQNIKNLDDMDMNNLQWILSEGIKIKGAFVAKDEKELGVRAFLNFGHTLGHAIEAEMGYGKMTHGEAVVIGMVFALKLSMKYLNLKLDLNMYMDWIQQLGYKIQIPNELSLQGLVSRMKQDKKSVNQEIRMVLLSDIGSPVLHSFSEEIILQELAEY